MNEVPGCQSSRLRLSNCLLYRLLSLAIPISLSLSLYQSSWQRLASSSLYLSIGNEWQRVGLFLLPSLYRHLYASLSISIQIFIAFSLSLAFSILIVIRYTLFVHFLLVVFLYLSLLIHFFFVQFYFLLSAS